jgi:rubrerythrin
MTFEEGLIRSFEDLEDIENTARHVYEELLEKLTDRELRDFTAGLIEAEKHHKKLVEEALELIQRD